MARDGCNCYFSFWANFCPFTPLTVWKIKISKKQTKKKKTTGDIIIWDKCTKNHDHMLYCSWDMARDGCNCYFSFWAIFCPFIPLAAPKMKISKKWKRRLEISSFKVSEYRFKENKNTLKNIKVLLYTHFYNIFLNVLRPTPFSVYVIYPFHTFQISEKLGSKFG